MLVGCKMKPLWKGCWRFLEEHGHCQAQWHAYGPSYSGGWGKRIIYAHKFKTSLDTIMRCQLKDVTYHYDPEIPFLSIQTRKRNQRKFWKRHLHTHVLTEVFTIANRKKCLSVDGNIKKLCSVHTSNTRRPQKGRKSRHYTTRIRLWSHYVNTRGQIPHGSILMTF